MRVSSQAIALWSLLAHTEGFAPSVSFVKKTALFGARNLHEFDYLLGEHSGNQQPLARSRRGLLPIENGKQQVRLTSAVMETEAVASEDAVYGGYSEEDFLEDEYSEEVGKITTFQEKKATNGALEWVKQADLQEILWTIAVPAVVVAMGVQFVTKQASAKMEGNADELLESFATEMMYHDGDFEEMKACQKDYGTRLLWLGPKKNDIMLKKYLELYAKKKTVTPKAISSMSYVFQIFGLSEEKAANTLVSLCKQLGQEKISTAGKLYFFGSRILKSAEGKKALSPIREMIMATFRDDGVNAEGIVELSQKAIGEAAYRSTVQSGGKNQNKLTPGWELLGLDKETASLIYVEEGGKGFKTDLESMYGNQNQQYNKKGQKVDAAGNLIDEKDIAAAKASGEDVEAEDDPNNIYECGNCGFTIFIAQGRESKFYGTGFACPECGATKDQFKGRIIEDE